MFKKVLFAYKSMHLIHVSKDTRYYEYEKFVFEITKVAFFVVLHWINKF